MVLTQTTEYCHRHIVILSSCYPDMVSSWHTVIKWHNVIQSHWVSPGVVLAQTTESFLWGAQSPRSCSGLSRIETFFRTGLSLPSLPAASPGSEVRVKLWLGEMAAGRETRRMIRNKFKRKMLASTTSHFLQSQNTLMPVTTLPVSCVSPWCHVRGCQPGERINSDTYSTVTLAQYYLFQIQHCLRLYFLHWCLSQHCVSRVGMSPRGEYHQWHWLNIIVSGTGSILMAQAMLLTLLLVTTLIVSPLVSRVGMSPRGESNITWAQRVSQRVSQHH